MSSAYPSYHKLLYLNTALPGSIGSGSHQQLVRTGGPGTNAGSYTSLTPDMAQRAFLGPFDLNPVADFVTITGLSLVTTGAAQTVSSCTTHMLAIAEPLTSPGTLSTYALSATPAILAANEAGNTTIALLEDLGTHPLISLPFTYTVPRSVVTMTWANTVAFGWPFFEDSTAVANGDNSAFTVQLMPPRAGTDAAGLNTPQALGADFMPYRRGWVAIKFVPTASASITGAAATVAIVATGWKYVTRAHPEEGYRVGTSRVTLDMFAPV